MSNFGKGFAYCLGLYLCHADKRHQDKKDYDKIGTGEYGAGLWANGAGDHLYEFQAEKAPEKIRARCIAFQDRVLKARLNSVTWDDIEGMIQEAKDLLREYDEICGFEVEKGDWE